MSHLARLTLARLSLTFALLAAPAQADQKDSAIFDVSIRGIPAATLTFSGAIEGQSYAARGTLKSSGILGLVKRIRYDATAAGRVAGVRFTPSRYTERADTGKRQSEAVMDYRKGVPQVKSYIPPRPPQPSDVDPAAQGGTVDPLTALYGMLRAVPEAEACTFRAFMFDGRRRSQIVLGKRSLADGSITCPGEYRRLEGFSPEELAEKSRFPFIVTYGPAGDGMVQVIEITMDTLYGKGRMIRR